jgi:hypothetical protein
MLLLLLPKECAPATLSTPIKKTTQNSKILIFCNQKKKM